jgi:hypothetical protein
MSSSFRRYDEEDAKPTYTPTPYGLEPASSLVPRWGFRSRSTSDCERKSSPDLFTSE